MKAQIGIGWLLLGLLRLCQVIEGHESGDALLRADAGFTPFKIDVPPATQPGFSVPDTSTRGDKELDGHANNTNSLRRRLHPDCNPNDFKPKLKYGPLFCGFPNQNLYNIAARAYIDALRLMHAGVQIAQRCGGGRDPIFNRYFNSNSEGETVQQAVADVLVALLGPSGAGADKFLDPGFEHEIWHEVPPPDGLQPGQRQSCDRPRTYGYVVPNPDEIRDVYTVMCPIAFNDPDFQRSLDSYGCNDLEAAADTYMICPGSLMLHELMHWNRLTTEAVTGLDIIDWNWQGIAGVKPPNGYGPSDAYALQIKDLQPYYNADSYVWFALESYWSLRCSHTFLDPGQMDTFEAPDLPDYVPVYPPTPPGRLPPPSVPEPPGKQAFVRIQSVECWSKAKRGPRAGAAGGRAYSEQNEISS